MKTRTILTTAAASVLVLAACGGDDAASEPTTVTMAASDYAFDLPDEIEAGLTTFEMPNEGAEAHHAQLVRLKPGGSFDAALAALGEEDFETIFQNVSVAGGVGIVAPGATQSATVNLTPGEYAFLCGLPSPDGTPHVAKGMLSTFTVTGETPAQVPQVDTIGEVTLSEFAFGIPEDVDGTVAVTNTGQQPHEMLLVQLSEGVPLEEGLASLEAPPPADGPPPAMPAGGLQAIMPGDTGYLDLSALEPGTYALVCFLPDPQSGKPHLELGMVAQLEVP